jgi:hypothetical protein
VRRKQFLHWIHEGFGFSDEAAHERERSQIHEDAQAEKARSRGTVQFKKRSHEKRETSQKTESPPETSTDDNQDQNQKENNENMLKTLQPSANTVMYCPKTLKASNIEPIYKGGLEHARGLSVSRLCGFFKQNMHVCF